MRLLNNENDLHVGMSRYLAVTVYVFIREKEISSKSYGWFFVFWSVQYIFGLYIMVSKLMYNITERNLNIIIHDMILYNTHAAIQWKLYCKN